MGDGESLAEKAYEQLEKTIVTLRLAPGEVFAELDLGAWLQLGRNSIGKALHYLA